MRIAHISDLHFGSASFGPMQFLSKRWLGNFNYFFHRKKEFLYNRLIDLINFFKEQGITHVIITGDLSVTSRKKEFKMAKRYIDLLKKEGLSVFTIPGNHDHYTKRSDRKKHFYRFFDTHYDKDCPFNLKQHKVTYTRLKEGLWLMGIDTTVATSLISSQGHFTPEVEENLTKALKEIPKYEKVILLNHFPFFYNDAPKKHLVRGSLLKNLLQKHPNVQLYLHGHTHRQTVADLRGSDLPIISDSGSTPHIKNGACHLFDFGDNTIKLDVYRYEGEWKKSESHTFET
ncbi:MAG: 3',5'-cyclic adenosine monophosphate phosphodiesterase CpdA [Chlamydiae bacterium]|nr:3',5'-cyclic adenosine monophosphate phosphodiesterase CpdA [Chlamydiota bacterium]